MSIIITQSKIKNREHCEKYKFSGNFEAERGYIIHFMISNNLAVPNCKAYRGEIEFFAEVHDFNKYEEVAHRALPFCKEEGQHNILLKAKLTDDITLEGELDWFRRTAFDRAEIIDWKTGTSFFYNVNEPISVIQSILYPYLVFMNNPDISEIAFKYVFLDEDCKVFEVINDRADFEGFDKDLVKFLVDFANDKVKLKTGNYCVTCSQFWNCKAVEQMIKEQEQRYVQMQSDVNFVKSDDDYKALCLVSKFFEKQVEGYLKKRKDEELHNESMWKSRNMTSLYLDVDKLRSDEKEKLIQIFSKEGQIKLTKEEAKDFSEKVTKKEYQVKVFKL